MELLLPLLIPMAWYSPLVSIGSAIMQPLYWVVSGILVLAHGLFAPLFGSQSGWTWALSIVTLTVFIRTALMLSYAPSREQSAKDKMSETKGELSTSHSPYRM